MAGDAHEFWDAVPVAFIGPFGALLFSRDNPVVMGVMTGSAGYFPLIIEGKNYVEILFDKLHSCVHLFRGDEIVVNISRVPFHVPVTSLAEDLQVPY